MPMLVLFVEPGVEELLGRVAPYFVRLVNVTLVDGPVKIILVLFPNGFEQHQFVGIFLVLLFLGAFAPLISPWNVYELRSDLGSIRVVELIDTNVHLDLHVIQSLASIPPVCVTSGGLCPSVVGQDDVDPCSFFHSLVDIWLQVSGLDLVGLGRPVDSKVIGEFGNLGISNGITMLRVNIGVGT